MQRRFLGPALLVSILASTGGRAIPEQPSARSGDKSWIAISNRYAGELMQVVFRHHPEAASAQGLSQFDRKASQPTLADEDRERQETEAVLARLKRAAAEKPQKDLAEDLQIMIRNVELQFRRQDFARSHEVPFYNASGSVFGGVRMLLDEQTAADRRPSAVARIREYAGIEPGYVAMTEILKQRTLRRWPGRD